MTQIYVNVVFSEGESFSNKANLDISINFEEVTRICRILCDGVCTGYT